MESRGTLFREIHKNTWLKRVTADNRKIPVVGTKKPERFWVVFCVHDDFEALLEGYVEPKLAASHKPDWTVSLQSTLHISHTLVPSENEYEFVITLSGETVRFNAATWEIMQEWVDTLRLKLREMKILSPKENLYSKLPELRPPLLPTRDPNSPLPATPPVPLNVPGVIVNTTQTSRIGVSNSSIVTAATNINSNSLASMPSQTQSSSSLAITSTSTVQSEPSHSQIETSESQSQQIQHSRKHPSTSTTCTPSTSAEILMVSDALAHDVSNNDALNLSSAPMSSTSNTLTSNLIKMLYPVTTYCHQANNVFPDSVISLNEETNSNSQTLDISTTINEQINELNEQHTNENTSSLARTFANNVLSDPGTSLNSKRGQSIASTTIKTATNDDSISVDSSVYSIYPSPEPIVIPRPHTTRGSTSKNKRIDQNLENQLNDGANDSATTNITIIQVSSAIVKEKVKITTSETAPTIMKEHDDINYKNNVQIIPSNFSPSNQNAITTVQVTTSDANTSISALDEQGSSTSNANIKCTKNINLNEPKSAQPTADEPRGNNNNNNAQKFGGVVTNITVNSQPEPLHYEQVFVTHSPTTTTIPTVNSDQNEIASLEVHINRIKLNKIDATQRKQIDSITEPSTSTSNAVTFSVSTANGTQSTTAKMKDLKMRPIEAKHENELIRRPLLTRGLTEAVISRPSRKDTNMAPNRSNQPGIHGLITEFQANVQHPDHLSEQRKRSSSTSDTQRTRNRSNNNNVISNANQYVTTNNVNNNTDFRHTSGQGVGGFRPNIDIALRASGRLTLREQQVIQLRREMMHPGGVRIQLRRKDCLSSIAFVDAFGAAWVSGWKQKEHPMLYNALHIGDQIISIAGITTTNAKEANKIINNATGQFVEFIIRRVPFGRVYAIRREIERQCLGLIRDGNTATIVDVVPNSLSARHGLPPKAQSCDALSLTFWVLTEINGRPLNLFFKENEVRDRLNSVGRDISILVQPSDLISKLKKQLKSLRNYKDYIVQ